MNETEGVKAGDIQGWSCPGNQLIPLIRGTLEGPEDDGSIHLIGSKCDDCGQRMFPARVRCVSCYGANLRSVRLERVGKVDCFTIVRQAPPGYAGPVPYVLAMVNVGNDIHVLAHLTGKPVQTWRAGETVAACTLRLPLKAAPGGEAFCYAFRPATAEDLN